MRAPIAVVAASLALAACGYGPEDSSPDPTPAPTPTPTPAPGARALILANEYAASLFTVTIVEHPSGRTRILFTDLRLDMLDRATATGAIGADSTSVTITARTTSLGEVYTFPPHEMKLDRAGDVGLTYRYDLATAGFQMGYGFR